MLALMVCGRLVDGEIEVKHVVTLETTTAVLGTSLPGARLDLIDDVGRIVATAPVQVLDTGAYGGPVICAVIPEPPRGSTLRIVRDEEETWIREPAGAPPRVEGLQSAVEGGCVRLTWQEEVYAAEVLRLVRWSADEGETWQVCAGALDAGEATVPMAQLPPGSVLVQVIISDGFDTAVSEWSRLDIPSRAAASQRGG
jgi:hypothetical protein